MNQYENSLKDFEKAIEIKKDLSKAYNMMTEVLVILGKNTEALEICKNAIKVDPKNSMAFFNKGKILASFGQNKEAINDYEEAIKILSNSSEIDIILYHKFLCHNALGEINEMNDVLKEIIDISPELIVAHVCELAKLGKSEEILKIIITKIQDNPKKLILYKLQMDFLLELGRDEEALKIMTAYSEVYCKIQ